MALIETGADAAVAAATAGGEKEGSEAFEESNSPTSLLSCQ